LDKINKIKKKYFKSNILTSSKKRIVAKPPLKLPLSRSPKGKKSMKQMEKKKAKIEENNEDKV